jgi:hypothetical protein
MRDDLPLVGAFHRLAWAFDGETLFLGSAIELGGGFNQHKKRRKRAPQAVSPVR